MGYGATGRYRGVFMKSLGEVEWARHFDDEGIAWEYEPVRFRNGGVRYTPDFRLAGLPIFLEVKPGTATLLGINNGLHLVHTYSPHTSPSSEHPLMVVFGTPDKHEMWSWGPGALTRTDGRDCFPATLAAMRGLPQPDVPDDGLTPTERRVLGLLTARGEATYVDLWQDDHARTDQTHVRRCLHRLVDLGKACKQGRGGNARYSVPR